MEDIDFNQYFYYDESSSTGLRWCVDIFSGNSGRVHKVKKHQEAGGTDSNKGYLVVRVCSKNYLVHRIIWKILKGELNHQIDHIDGNRRNNKIENLREVTPAQNSKNKAKGSNNTSGVVGVSFTITNNGQTYVVGNFKCCQKQISKHFSVKKFGLLPAFKMAFLFRENGIAELISKGEDYTERHGK